MGLSLSHDANVSLLSSKLRAGENFDIIERHLTVNGTDLCFFYVDGFVKDSEMQRLMEYLLSLKSFDDADTLVRSLPYIEVELGRSVEQIVTAVLSGQTALLLSVFPCVPQSLQPPPRLCVMYRQP